MLENETKNAYKLAFRDVGAISRIYLTLSELAFRCHLLHLLSPIRPIAKPLDVH
jgi:hypothetical protein